MNKKEFIEELKKLNIEITNTQLEQLELYKEALITENKKYNLTAITKEEDIYLKHFYDCLTLYKAFPISNQYICDIGTGAGFPGLVLKIIFPDIKIDLIDATSKKCHFLEMIVKTLNLKEVNIINTRIEDYSTKTREKYDVVVSRAVAPIKHLLEYAVPLLKVNGYFIALKGNIEEETQNIDNYYKKLSLTEEKIISFKLPKENSQRTILVIKKIKKTDLKYPRKYQIMLKKEI